MKILKRVHWKQLGREELLEGSSLKQVFLIQIYQVLQNRKWLETLLEEQEGGKGVNELNGLKVNSKGSIEMIEELKQACFRQQL